MTRLQKVFSGVLGIPEDSVGSSLAPENTPTWDSLNAIILLTEIEKEFNLRFEYSEAMAIKNFADVMALIASKGQNPNV